MLSQSSTPFPPPARFPCESPSPSFFLWPCASPSPSPYLPSSSHPGPSPADSTELESIIRSYFRPISIQQRLLAQCLICENNPELRHRSGRQGKAGLLGDNGKTKRPKFNIWRLKKHLKRTHDYACMAGQLEPYHQSSAFFPPSRLTTPSSSPVPSFARRPSAATNRRRLPVSTLPASRPRGLCTVATAAHGSTAATEVCYVACYDLRNDETAGPTPATLDAAATTPSSSSANHISAVDVRTGAVIHRWFGASPSEPFGSPYGIAHCLDDGLLYISDFGSSRVQVYDTAGGFVRQWGGDDSDETMRLKNPTGIAVARNADGLWLVYVADWGNSRVQVYDRHGARQRMFGEKGEGEGQMKFPLGLAVGLPPAAKGPRRDGVALPRQLICYLCDRDNNRVTMWAEDGSFVGSFHSTAADGRPLLSKPAAIAIRQDHVFVTQGGGLQHAVQMFTTDGDYYSGWSSQGTREGQLRDARGITVSSANNSVYLADTGNARLQVTARSDNYWAWGPNGDPIGGDTMPLVSPTPATPYRTVVIASTLLALSHERE